MQRGVSIAAVAMAHGINANLLRRWVKDAEMKPVAQAAVATPSATPLQLKPSFVPITVPASEPTAAPIPAPAPAPTPAPTPTQDIRIELRRNAMTVTVTWPASGAAECGAWLRELLR